LRNSLNREARILFRLGGVNHTVSIFQANFFKQTVVVIKSKRYHAYASYTAGAEGVLDHTLTFLATVSHLDLPVGIMAYFCGFQVCWAVSMRCAAVRAAVVIDFLIEWIGLFAYCKIFLISDAGITLPKIGVNT
jgi:hypothetical protein